MSRPSLGYVAHQRKKLVYTLGIEGIQHHGVIDSRPKWLETSLNGLKSADLSHPHGPCMAAVFNGRVEVSSGLFD